VGQRASQAERVAGELDGAIVVGKLRAFLQPVRAQRAAREHEPLQ
jgi:hypothetical protein